MFDRSRLSEEDDRTLDWFLGIQPPAQGTFGAVENASISVEDGKLRIHRVSVAWYDTAGALWAVIPLSAAMYDAAHTISDIAQRLGLPALERTSFEPSSVETTGSGARWPTVAWTLGDEVIKLGEPFMLCGPMGVQAYRAERMAK